MLVLAPVFREAQLRSVERLALDRAPSHTPVDVPREERDTYPAPPPCTETPKSVHGGRCIPDVRMTMALKSTVVSK